MFIGSNWKIQFECSSIVTKPGVLALGQRIRVRIIRKSNASANQFKFADQAFIPPGCATGGVEILDQRPCILIINSHENLPVKFVFTVGNKSDSVVSGRQTYAEMPLPTGSSPCNKYIVHIKDSPSHSLQDGRDIQLISDNHIRHRPGSNRPRINCQGKFTDFVK